MADYEGGLAGGLARGLESGVSLGSNLYQQAADQKMKQQQFGLQQQQFGLQQQEFGLQKRGSERADAAQSLEFGKARVAALTDQKKMYDDLSKGAAASGNAAARQHYDDVRNDLNKGIHDAYSTLIDQTAAPVYQQTMNTAQQLQQGKVDWHDLTPEQQSNQVTAATGQPAIQSVNGPQHISEDNPDGTAPLQQSLDDVHYHAANSNWPAAAEAAYPFVSPHISGHPPDHELHVPGINAGEHGMAPDDPNMPHAAIAQTADIVGKKGAVVAAVNADPQTQQNLIDAHANGVTDQQDMFLKHVRSIGGVQNLGTVAAKDPVQQDYEKAKASAIDAGTDPAEAHSQASEQTIQQQIDAREDRTRLWLMDNGQEMPASLKRPEQKIAYDALIAAGNSPSQAALMAYAPSVATEKLRVGAEAGLRNAQIAEANARVNWMKRRGLTPYVDDTGNIYTQDPDDPSRFIDASGAPPPPGVIPRPMNKGATGPKYDPYALAKDSYDRQMAGYNSQMAERERLSEASRKRLPPLKMPDLHEIYEQELNRPPIRTAPTPGVTSPTPGTPPVGPTPPVAPVVPPGGAPQAAVQPAQPAQPAQPVQTIKGPVATVGTIMRDKHGNAVQSLGNGNWKPL